VKSPHDPREGWRSELTRTSECVPLDRLGEALTAAEREHLGHCVRCQTERALSQQFQPGAGVGDEGAAVPWIVAEIRRRSDAVTAAAPARRWLAWIPTIPIRTLLAASATLGVAVAIGYVVENREPSIQAPAAGETHRSGSVQVTGPVGDVREPPRELRWLPVADAARYDVVVREVDLTTLWQMSTRDPHVELPADVIARFVSGKPILWDVTARGSDGAAVAHSGTQRFRVDVGARPQKE
jgi:hypothetical protein